MIASAAATDSVAAVFYFPGNGPVHASRPPYVDDALRERDTIALALVREQIRCLEK